MLAALVTEAEVRRWQCTGEEIKLLALGRTPVAPIHVSIISLYIDFNKDLDRMHFNRDLDGMQETCRTI